MIKQTIAEDLLAIEAVTLSPNKPFTWSSGIQSPIYCDNRMTLSFPAIRKAIAHGLSDIIAENFPYCDVIAGTSTAGIPHAAWVSDILDLPMVYVRSEAKKHGKGNQIEGKITPGQKVIVIEDLISSGGSSITCANALRKAGCEVLCVLAIFTYELEKGIKLFAENDLAIYSLSDYSTLITVAKEKGIISEEELTKLEKWRQNPDDTSWIS